MSDPDTIYLLCECHTDPAYDGRMWSDEEIGCEDPDECPQGGPTEYRRADTDRLARIDAACLLRSEIDAPEWAAVWHKGSDGGAAWFGEDELYAPEFEEAPDYRPNDPGPITLPILEA